MSMSDTTKEKADYRSSVRLNDKTAKRLEKVAKSSGLTVSDVVRLMIVKTLPEMEAGRLTIPRKEAA
jgi:predicted DNA-binding protein